MIILRYFTAFQVCLWAASTYGAQETTRITADWPLGLSPETMPSPSADNHRAELGEYLFRSPVLSADGTVSCSSCHIASLGFSGNLPRAVGVAGFTATRRAPPLFNFRSNQKLMWDGRATGLEAQIVMPLESPEMDIHWPSAISTLEQKPDAVRIRQQAGIKEFSRKEIIGSIASYLQTLVSGDSRFDRFYYRHDIAALSEQEQRGLRLFTRKAHCSTCHLIDGAGAPLTDASFHATGIGFVAGAYTDHGRFRVTENRADDGLFKTPSLRNVSLRPFLMHDGSRTSLKDVVIYYNRGGNRDAANLDNRIQPLFLNEGEVEDIVAFLGSLASPVLSYRHDSFVSRQN